MKKKDEKIDKVNKILTKILILIVSLIGVLLIVNILMDIIIESYSFNVNWDVCINTTIADLTDSEFFNYVRDIDIKVDEKSKEIVFTAVLSDAVKPEIALDFADIIIRRFNTSAIIQNRSIKSSTKDYYGELYDRYDILVCVAPFSQTQNVEKWFILHSIEKKRHTKNKPKLQKYYLDR